MYNNRSEFIEDNISEKITLARIEASSRLYEFEEIGNNVYRATTKHIVTNVKDFTTTCDINNCSTAISTLNLNNGSIIQLNDGESLELNEVTLELGHWVYDVATKSLYIRLDTDINTTKIIVTYMLLFSDAPIVTTWDLTDNSVEVEYEARIQRTPSFKTSIGSNQRGISVTNSGNIELNNTDGYFDSIYDNLIFENKKVETYSFSRHLLPSQSKILFRGNTYDKSFSSDKITLQCKDNYTRLEESIELAKYTSSDNVNSEDLSKFKRTIYGRVDGHISTSIDKIDNGYTLTGTLNTDINANITVTGKDTLFITDGIINIGDIVEVNGSEFEIITIDTETQLTMSSTDSSSVEANEDSMSKVELTQLTGSISTSVSFANRLEGLGTSFTTQISSGDTIKVLGLYLEVDSVIDDSNLVLTVNYPTTFISQPYFLKVETGLDGDVTFLSPNRIITGTNTQFLRDCSGSDVLTVGVTTYKIDRVNSDTELIVDEDSVIFFDIISATASNKSENGVPFKNRKFNLSGHSLKESYYTLVTQDQFNRITVSDSLNIRPDDYIEFIQTGVFQERAQVRRVSGNRIILKQNLNNAYDNTVTILKSPIYNVYVNNTVINKSDLTLVQNASTGCDITISGDVEFNIAETFNISNASFLFTSGSYEVQILGSNTDIESKIDSRDHIKAYGDSNENFVSVLRVDSDKIYLRSQYQGNSGVRNLTYKKVNVINDDTKVSVDLLGKPDDNVTTNELIEYGPNIIKDLLNNTELSDVINEQSFIDATESSRYTLGLVIPTNVTDSTTPTIKNIVDTINTTINGSMTIDNDLNISYNVLDVELPDEDELPIISTDSIIKWNIKSKSNSIYIYTNSSYRKNESTGSSLTHEATNETSIDFNTSNKTDNITLISYYDNDSQELTERSSYLNSLSKNEILIESDLRLSVFSMGDKLIVDIPRLYTRLGDPNTRKKVVTVIGIEVSGETTKLTVSDLGNLYNRTSIIASDTANDYVTSSSNDKLYTTYITDENGVIDNDKDIQNTNLIF